MVRIVRPFSSTLQSGIRRSPVLAIDFRGMKSYVPLLVRYFFTLDPWYFDADSSKAPPPLNVNALSAALHRPPESVVVPSRAAILSSLLPLPSVPALVDGMSTVLPSLTPSHLLSPALLPSPLSSPVAKKSARPYLHKPDLRLPPS